MEVSAEIVTGGAGFTEMFTVSFAMQPFNVTPVTIYWVAVATVAAGLAMLELLRPSAGDQL